MKKVLFISVLFLFAICFASSQAYAQGLWTGNVNVFYGIKALDSDDWAEEDFIDVSKHKEFGLNADFGPFTWPICFTFGYLSSSDDDTYTESWFGTEFFVDEYGDLWAVTDDYTYKFKADGSTSELRFGVKKIWEPVVPIRPYVGAGLAMIKAKIKVTESLSLATFPEFNLSESISDSDSAFGFWLTGGVYWTIARHFNLGVELGYSKAKVTLDKLEMEPEAGGIHYGLFAGYHW